MASHPDHYRTLGVANDASQADIKRRFRELARTHHPDVAKTQEAAEAFKTINEAYGVLGDAERRAAYDAECSLRTAQARSRAERASSAAHSTRSQKEATPRAQRPARPTADVAVVVAKLLRDARAAVATLRFHEAVLCCRHVLSLDRRCAEAHELLGDIAAARGKTDEALAEYSMAVQLDTRNGRLRTKLERLVLESSTRGATDEAYAAYARRKASGQAVVLMFGIAVITALLGLVSTAQGSDQVESWVTWEWSPAVFIGLPAAGAILGVVAAVGDYVRPARLELLMSPSRGHARAAMPIGLVLVVMSLVSFWLAGFLYVFAAATQDALSKSIAGAFVACAVLTGLFALVVPGGAWVAAFGGNLAFPAFVGGWTVGDALRR